MSAIGATLFGLILVVRELSPAPAFTPSEFQDWFRASAEGGLRIPRMVDQQARHFRYVFVGGFYNERIPGYFSHNAKELRARGVPRRAIHYIYPSSHKTFEENIEKIRGEFFAIADAGPEKLVVIAHSRGACDTLAFALRNAPFVLDRVEALFLIQGPFGGTGVADYLMGQGPPMDREMPRSSRIIAHLCGKVESYILKRGFHSGLPEMTRKASRQFWRRALADYADAIPIVGARTFYVQSRIHPSRLRLFHRAIAWYLQTYYGPNDGMVALEDQVLPGLGTSLGIFDASHTDLTHKFPSTRSARRIRRALMQSIVMAIGRSGPEFPSAQARR